LVPAVGRAGAPERAAARVGDRPADGHEVRIARVVVARIELDPVSVRVPQVDEERVRDTVPAGPALDRGGVARSGELVAGAQDGGRLGDGEADMVQPRPAAGGEGDVVHGRLTQEPGPGEALVVAVGGD